MSGYGYHWSKCPGGEGGGFLAIGAALVAGEVILSALWEIIAVTAACAVLVFAAVMALSRATARREAAYEASPQHQRLIGATVTPQVTQGTPPAIEQHVHYHYHAADGTMAARVIRQAIPGQAGDAITQGGNTDVTAHSHP